MTSPLSPLERALIELIASENWDGFRVDCLLSVAAKIEGMSIKKPEGRVASW